MSTKRVVTALAIGVIALHLVACGNQGEPAGKASGGPGQAKGLIAGTVSATEDDDGNITAVTLTTGDGAVYRVALDAKGSKLGEEMDGQKVEVRGTVTEKGSERWLTVAAFEKAKAQPWAEDEEEDDDEE